MSWLTVAWLALGWLASLAFLRYARSFGRARLEVLAKGLVIAAAIYVGFALVAMRADWLLVESVGTAVFGVAAWLGTRRSPLWLAAGWALHPLWDVALHLRGSGATVAPEWYVVACVSFDLAVAVSVYRYRRASSSGIAGGATPDR